MRCTGCKTIRAAVKGFLQVLQESAEIVGHFMLTADFRPNEDFPDCPLINRKPGSIKSGTPFIMGAAGLRCTDILQCEYRQNPKTAKMTPTVMRVVNILLSPVEQTHDFSTCSCKA